MRVWDGSKNSLSWIQIHGYCVFPQKEIPIAVIIEELFGMGTIQASDVMAVLYGNCAPQGVQAADRVHFITDILWDMNTYYDGEGGGAYRMSLIQTGKRKYSGN